MVVHHRGVVIRSPGSGERAAGPGAMESLLSRWLACEAGPL